MIVSREAQAFATFDFSQPKPTFLNSFLCFQSLNTAEIHSPNDLATFGYSSPTYSYSYLLSSLSPLLLLLSLSLSLLLLLLLLLLLHLHFWHSSILLFSSIFIKAPPHKLFIPNQVEFPFIPHSFFLANFVSFIMKVSWLVILKFIF